MAAGLTEHRASPERLFRGREKVWSDLDGLLTELETRPESLTYEDVQAFSILYQAVCADYSLAQLHFPKLTLTARLGRLCARGKRQLRAPQTSKAAQIWQFFISDFPRLFRRLAGVRRLSLGIFAIATIFGCAMGWSSDGFIEMLVAPDAIDYFQSGNLWTDEVSAGSELSATLYTNNVGVMLKAWGAGLLVGLGTVGILLFNGLHIGVVFGGAYRYQVDEGLVDWIAAHGPLELYVITVAGAAGLWLGRGIWVASTEPRREVFAQHAKESLLLMLGAAPWMVLAGIIEGFISPQDGLSTPIKAFVGAAALALMLGYTQFSARGGYND